MQSLQASEMIVNPIFIANAILNPKPEVIFIACGDPRFQDGFDDFRINFLDLPNGKFCPIRKAGGPTPLAHPTKTKSRCKGVVRQILLYRDLFPSINRIVLIAHGDCGYYVTVPPKCHNHGKEKRDLPLAGSLVKWLLPDSDVELYYSELANDGKKVVFEELQISHEVVTIPQEWLISHRHLIA